MTNKNQQIKDALLQAEDLEKLNGTASVLEFLWQQYRIHNPRSDRLIREADQRLTPYFDSLSSDRSDELFDILCDLCDAHEKAAFLRGAHIGAMIAAELQNS